MQKKYCFFVIYDVQFKSKVKIIKSISIRKIEILNDKGIFMYLDALKLDLRLNKLDKNFEDIENYRFITENVSDMISRHTLGGKFAYISPSCKKILGYEPKELIGVSLYELFHADDIEAVKRTYKSLLSREGVHILTYKMRRKDGTYVWLETSNKTIRDNHTNKAIEIICVSRDVTDSMKNKQMLERMVVFSEELLQISSEKIDYKSILENILDISNAKYGILNLYNESADMFVTTAIAGITDMVEKTTKLLGFEIIGKEWDEDLARNEKIKDNIVTYFPCLNDLVGGVVSPSLIRVISNVFRLGNVIVVKIMKDDKMIGDFTLIMQLGEQFENEKLVEIYSRQIGMFITRKRAEKALKEKEKMLNAISEATKLLLVDSDYTTTIPKVLELLGTSIGVDRVAYFETGYDTISSTRIATQKAEWSCESVEAQIDNPKLQNLSFEVLDILIPPLLKGKPFSVAVEDLQECTLKNMFMSSEILSILVLPIFVKDIFWGFVGFDECKCVKKWSESEISILHIFVDSVSKAIERKLYEEELEFLSYHDNLTGLYNRRKFTEISLAIDKSGDCPVSIIVGDVNGLKLVNDAFGHNSGDNLLKKIAEIIKRECGKNSYVARRGGDEFSAILPGRTFNEACAIIERIKQHCEEETTDELMLNISFGAETKTDENMDLQHCYSVAEDRMYSSKLLEGKSIRNKIIENFREVMEDKTGETRKHCERMAKLSVKVGNVMGMAGYEIENLKLLSLLHDIGKTGIPDSILLKPERLNENEMSIMKKHCEIGFRIANTLHELLPISDGILSHHERWDGTGYPRGLKGDEISLMARIVAVLDTFDALTNDRPYRKAVSVEKAFDEIKLCSGTQFDPDVVNVFINNASK